MKCVLRTKITPANALEETAETSESFHTKAEATERMETLFRELEAANKADPSMRAYIGEDIRNVYTSKALSGMWIERDEGKPPRGKRKSG